MARHRTHSVEFKRQVALEYLAGDTLKGLSPPHDISRNLVLLWVKKFEAGEFDVTCPARGAHSTPCA